jgi:hypothetical protein
MLYCKPYHSLTHKPMKKIIKHLLLFIAALVILFEEWLWDNLQAVMRVIGKLPVFKQIETLITKLPPKLALFVFIIPVLALLPFKLLAVKLFTSKKIILGTFTYITAKIVGTALIARLFKLTQPALMQLTWFAKYFQRFITWKEKLYTFLKNTRAWQHVQVLKQSITQWKRRLFPKSSKPTLFRRWRAARKLKKMQRKI